MTEIDDFTLAFEELTGNRPLLWQERLFRDFAINKLPDVIDLPTGLGKTMVMAIWLIARAMGKPLPRRLIYVVDRRTVVDQATDLAQMLVARPMTRRMHAAFGDQLPAISTLRGQLADNREWSRDPSRPAIIIGTVDLIGSGLLFSGYRSSYKERPLHAGMLGQDSLLVLDEAHLSKPFERLLVGYRRDGGPCQGGIEQFQAGKGTPMKVIRMSATSGDQEGNPFKLEPSDLADPIIRERFGATKQLTIEVKDKVDPKLLSDAAIKLAGDPTLYGKRIVVFVRKPETAKEVAKFIRKHDFKSGDECVKTTKTTPYEKSVEILTGTMRGLERDELLETRVVKRFVVADDPAADDGPCFLVSTSAGEVGFDLNADHMVCDLTTLDSLIQRLGRVNRRGGEHRLASIIVLAEVPKAKEKDGKLHPLSPLDAALKATFDLLYGLPRNGFLDVSPCAIAELKKSPSILGQMRAASTPEPTMVDLTDILLDSWSMTSITLPMPGRPEVAPWLRGIEENQQETTIAWRAELDLSGFDQLDIDEMEEWLDTHRIRTEETLSVPTIAAAKWFVERWDKLPDDLRTSVGERSIIRDRGGIVLLKVKEAIAELKRKPKPNLDPIRNADLIVPASFGGIERRVGLLDESAPLMSEEDKHKLPMERPATAAPDVADVRGRYRCVEDGKEPEEPIGSGKKPHANLKVARFTVELQSDDERTLRLVSLVPRSEKLEWGSERQSLCEHVGLVQKYANGIIEAFNLPSGDHFRLALELAAEYHDHGKNRERWQRLVDGTATPPGEKWISATCGKSGGRMRRDSRGYRHEFGSLREFTDAKGGKVAPNVFDLAMHLIATHHGRGRPHFPKGGFDPDAESRSHDIHTDSIRRFARLQRNYGHWRLAWLENLLRCADAMASAEKGDAAKGGAA